MLPPFDFAGDLVTEPFVFEKEISSDESFALSDVRALSTKRRTLCAFKGDGNPTDAAARSHAADEYVPHLEALVGKIGELGVTADRQQRFSFQWNSPLEGLGNTFKLSDIKQELGIAEPALWLEIPTQTGWGSRVQPLTAVAMTPSFPQPKERMRLCDVQVTEHHVGLLHAPRRLPFLVTDNSFWHFTDKS